MRVNRLRPQMRDLLAITSTCALAWIGLASIEPRCAWLWSLHGDCEGRWGCGGLWGAVGPHGAPWGPTGPTAPTAPCKPPQALELARDALSNGREVLWVCSKVSLHTHAPPLTAA